MDYAISCNYYPNYWMIMEEVVEYSHINSNFITEYDNWDKINRKGSFVLGKTSKALRSIGLEDRNIIMDKSKILQIQNDHFEMTDRIIKQIPNILEKPIIILNSKSSANINNNRIVVFGDVLDYKNKPVLVAIELNPVENNTNINKIYKIASAYGKEKLIVIQTWLNDRSNILYVDSDKKRTTKWLNGLGLQLPVPINAYGSKEQGVGFSAAASSLSVNNISQVDINVNYDISNNSNM